jgi:hypothetical protein
LIDTAGPIWSDTSTSRSDRPFTPRASTPLRATFSEFGNISGADFVVLCGSIQKEQLCGPIRQRTNATFARDPRSHRHGLPRKAGFPSPVNVQSRNTYPYRCPAGVSAAVTYPPFLEWTVQ